jgi:cytochrome c oxidase subunit 2
MALPATKVLVAQKDTTNADLTIKTTGYQWKWGYDYLKGEGEGIVLPVHARQQPPRHVQQRQCVPGACGLPAEGGQPPGGAGGQEDPHHHHGQRRDPRLDGAGLRHQAGRHPGFVRDTWFRAEKVGDYYGQCAELCGKEHAYMPIHVKVLSAKDYSAWVGRAKEEAPAALLDDPKRKCLGAATTSWRAVKRCTPPTARPATRPAARVRAPIKALDGSAIVKDQDAARQIQVLLQGAANGAMPSWKQLSDTDLAAVISYTKNAWSNKTGQLVQPADVVAQRGK